MGRLEDVLSFDRDQIRRLQKIGSEHSQNTDSGAGLLLAIYDDERLAEIERDYLLFQSGLNFSYRELIRDRVANDAVHTALMNNLEDSHE